MATRSVPTRSISHSILSPATVAATPDGVPVMIDVTRGQLNHFRQFRNELGHFPDHLIEIAVLAHLAVDLERNATFLGMADLTGRAQRSAGC